MISQWRGSRGRGPGQGVWGLPPWGPGSKLKKNVKLVLKF